MGAFFRDTLSVHSPLPLDLLVRVLRDKLVPPDSSGNWFLGPLTHPFRGDVTPEGFALWTRYAKLTPRSPWTVCSIAPPTARTAIKMHDNRQRRFTGSPRLPLRPSGVSQSQRRPIHRDWLVGGINRQTPTIRLR